MNSLKNTGKGKHFIISYVIYPFDLLVSIGESDKDVLSILEKRGVKGDENLITLNGRKGRCIMFSGGQTLIRIHRLKTPIDYSILQHEIFHAVQFLFERIGMPLTDSSSEAYTYLIGYITKEIYERK